MSQGSSSQQAPSLGGQPQLGGIGIFEQRARRRLEENAPRLFSPLEINLMAVTFEPTSTLINTTVISNINDLESFLQGEISQSQHHTFIFINPVHSWGPLRITSGAFTKLTAAFPVSPAFLDFVASFGVRINDVDSNTGGHGRNCFYGPAVRELDGQQGGKQMVSDDFSFLLTYPERHGRTWKNPWSMRQVAVHKSHDHKRRTSKWIFIHCPQYLQNEIVSSLAKVQGCPTEKGEAIPLDFILAGTSQNWRDYINYLESEITVLNEKACYSCVERTKQHDYAVGFSDAQTLHGLRRKLLKGVEAIDQALDVMSAIGRHRDDLEDMSAVCRPSKQNPNFEFLFTRYQNHRRNLNALADFQQGASALFLKMLDQRNDQVLHLQNEVMNNLAVEAKKEGKFMKDISEKMQRDSRSMRVLSSVAFVYLPASLIAAVFNSNLLQLVAPGDPAGQRNHLIVTSQIWIFAVLTVVLTLLTILGVWVWSKWTQVLDSRRRANPVNVP